MAVQERDYMKGPAPAPGQAPKLLDRLNELGEKHATAIIAVSTLLIILTVLIFAKYFYDKSQVERAEQELSTADSVEQLAGLKTKYGSTPVAPRILFRLANKYYEDGKLDLARNEYKDFQQRFPNDRLSVFVARALNSLERNARFDAEGKEARLKQHLLTPHPRQLSVRQLRQRRREARAIRRVDAEVERLERRGGDGHGHDDAERAAVHVEIVGTSPSTISVGSVIDCTCSAVTPGASSTSFSPFSVTSSTQ